MSELLPDQNNIENIQNKEIDNASLTPLDPIDQARRWRLMLGRYADRNLSAATLSGEQLKLERNLDYLYQHEYKRRGIEQGKNRHGGLEASQ